jgi:cytochrome c peroxidase
MKPVITAVVLLGLFVTCNRQNTPPATEQVHRYVETHLGTLSAWLAQEFVPLTGAYTDSNSIRQSFLKGRKLYKHVEFAVEYFFPNAARNLNGPPLPEIEPEEHITLEPGGFQVLEESLFPFDTAAKKAVAREAQKLKSMLYRVKMLWDVKKLRDDQVFDAVRFECFRIITLGISGFDTPLSQAGISEVPQALRSVRDVLQLYDRKDAPVLPFIDKALAYASTQSDFDAFDRMGFIKTYINPLTTALFRLQQAAGIPVLKNLYALKGNVKTLFDTAAFNLNYFTPDANAYSTPERAALGNRLFFDPVVSEAKNVSCASCHQPEKGFSDGLPLSRALASTGFLKRNTPGLGYAGLQRGQFYDMRAAFLEDQVKGVIENRDEIHGDLKKVAAALRNDTLYARYFRLAFPGLQQPVSEGTVLIALSAYIRSLATFDSRFDQYMRGDSTKMNGEEIRGFNLFMGKGKCGMCHFMPLFNGTVPPAFIFTESEVIGVPFDKKGTKLDADPGRFGIYKIENFRNAFKTPTVRNSSATAPYMHNGVFTTLDEVVDFYDRGGGAGLGLDVPNQTLPFDSLRLSPDEKKAIVAFMHTLTDAPPTMQTATR